MKANRREMLLAGAAALGGCVSPGNAWAVPPTPNPVVELTSGRVDGLHFRATAGDTVRQFLGIPYGADTGPRRFLPPQPITPWTGAFNAWAYGPPCPQGSGGADQSENCLVLNVWAPLHAENAKRPVLVYIHGGGYTSGNGASPLTHGANLAARGDVVVVTLNHRLNLFGHMSLGAVAGADYAASGNAGLLDLVLALQWVRDNAAAFGGDPGNVTLFGQSGGGAKIACLMAMPAAKGLFHRVWTMSGQQVTVQGPRGATARAKAAMEHLGVDVDTLRTMPAAKLLEALSAKDPSIAGSRIYWGPVLDELTLQAHPFWPDAPALSRDIPMVMGNTREETGSLIARGDPAIFDLTWDTLPARLERDMVSDVDVHAAIAMYRRLYPELPPAQVFIRATSAGRSWRAQVIEAEARARQGAPTWVYQLDYSSRSNGGRHGAYHMLDIPLVFANTHEATADTGDDAAARAMAATMSDALLRFARTGDPNGGALPAWPQHELQRRETMMFDVATRVESDPRGEERRFFGVAPYIQPGTY
jgi:para-nitrobenzyl esterase